MKTKPNLYLTILAEVNHDRAVREGFFDGRFRQRVVVNKKNQEHKLYRKNKKIEV